MGTKYYYLDINKNGTLHLPRPCSETVQVYPLRGQLHVKIGSNIIGQVCYSVAQMVGTWTWTQKVRDQGFQADHVVVFFSLAKTTKSLLQKL